ncbi:MAG: hypothetical protein ACRCYE_06020 [Sarcina sp.]
MKVIYQEKDSPNSIGEFEILDEASLEILSRKVNSYIAVRDSDFFVKENNTRVPNLPPINQGQNIGYGVLPYPLPHNLGHPPSKNPTYNTTGVVKLNDCYCLNCACTNKKIKLCAYRHTYIWLKNGKSFWCYPIHITNTAISGWKWLNYTWKFFSTPINKISHFYCYK